jgi:hypothetical protein
VAAAQALGSKAGIAYALEVLAAIRARSAKAGEAARLLGAAEAIRKSIDEPELETLEARIHGAALERINEQLDPGTVSAEWSLGASMTLDEAVAFAVEETADVVADGA